MEKEVMYQFLVKTAIPVNKWGKETETDSVRDAIWRAHRDTLTGRFQLKEYRKYTEEGERKHKVTDALYKKIKECIDSYEALSSEPLIKYLDDNFKGVEFGAIQKLVNMSLKYLIILKAFGFEKTLEIDEAKCDCPLDSVILGKLGYTEMRWTKISEEEYVEVQNKIRKTLSSEEKNMGNIVYDFIHW